MTPTENQWVLYQTQEFPPKNIRVLTTNNNSEGKAPEYIQTKITLTNNHYNTVKQQK